MGKRRRSDRCGNSGRCGNSDSGRTRQYCKCTSGTNGGIGSAREESEQGRDWYRRRDCACQSSDDSATYTIPARTTARTATTKHRIGNQKSHLVPLPHLSPYGCLVTASPAFFVAAFFVLCFFATSTTAPTTHINRCHHRLVCSDGPRDTENVLLSIKRRKWF